VYMDDALSGESTSRTPNRVSTRSVLTLLECTKRSGVGEEEAGDVEQAEAEAGDDVAEKLLVEAESDVHEEADREDEGESGVRHSLVGSSQIGKT
jgi:hypothetical protein